MKKAGFLFILLTSAVCAFGSPGQTRRVPVNVAVPSFIPEAHIGSVTTSSDGNYAVVETSAKILPSDTNASTDIYRCDLNTGAILHVSKSTTGGSSTSGGHTPSISSNGRYIAFLSSSTNMTTPAGPSGNNVYVRDMLTDTITIHTTVGNIFELRISPTGDAVALVTGNALVAGDVNSQRDVYHRLLNDVPGIFTLASITSGGVQGNNLCAAPYVSGNLVAFETISPNFAAGDTTDTDVFVKDLSTGALTKQSLTFAGGEPITNVTLNGLADDGSKVLMITTNTSMLATGTSGFVAVVRNIATGVNSAGATTSAGISVQVLDAALGGNSIVGFTSTATNIVPGEADASRDCFVRDLTSGVVTHVSIRSTGVNGASTPRNVSPSSLATRVTMLSDDPFMVPGTTSNHIQAYSRIGATTNLVCGTGSGNMVNDVANQPAISSEGRYVVFTSGASNLVTTDTNGFDDIFVNDSQTDITTLVTRTSGGDSANQAASSPKISPDGRFIAFITSASNLAGAAVTGSQKATLYDQQTGTYEFFAPTLSGGQAPVLSVACSNLGAYAAFVSGTTNLVPGDTNSANDVFRYNNATNSLELVTVASGGGFANNSSSACDISGDGNLIVFQSGATNLIPGGTNAQSVYLRDMSAGTTICVSKNQSGVQQTGSAPSITPDGEYVVFFSQSTLLPGVPASTSAIYRYQRSTGEMRVLGMSASDVYTNYTPSVPGVSDDGRFVSFISQSNLLPGSNGTPQGYIYDFDFYQPYHVSRNGLTGSASNVSGLVLSAGGNFCAFTTAANSGLTSERQPYSGVFRHELQPGYTFTLTGTMNYAGWSGPNALPQLTLQFRQGTGATISKNVTCQPDGSFTLDMVLPTLGNWDIFGKSFTTLRKKAGTFDFTGANLNLGTINLLNGDSVDDNVIDLSDYTVIVSRFNSVETDFSWQARADLNGDKVVDLTDYTIIVVNFNAIGE